jgi:hypothetical protein
MPVQFEIHPTIGISRLGTSDGFFIGPEPDRPPPTSYRDEGGILRQAARFRIFRVERAATGAVVTANEITSDTADIEWTVHLANRKATAFRMLQQAPVRRNNATGDEQADQALIIDPGPQSVSEAVAIASFDTGTFRGMPVPLGEARFETKTGRLLVLGGRGRSDVVKPGRSVLKHFADNDGWFDDTAEGPISATVRLKATGEQPDVSGARVVVAPPDFAPEIQNFVTLYDIVYQMALDKGLVPKPSTFSFMRFVHPILMRASGYHWVNAAAGAGHGGSARMNFAASMDRFGDPRKSLALRRRVFSVLRDPQRTATEAAPAMPRLFAAEGYPEKAYRPVALTPIQYDAFSKWATVPDTPPDFVWDAPRDPWAGQSLPDALDRVALEACAGGAFFPGIEAPAFIADGQNYEATLPVRLLDTIPAGTVNAASAVPWQADFFQCRWEGASEGGLEAFFGQDNDYGWWPAQRPDSVFTEPNLETRVKWDAGVRSMNQMVKAWTTRGFVLRSSNARGETIFIQRKPET